MEPSERDIEALLLSVPTRRLKASDREGIADSIRAAAGERPGWWRRPIPAWQAMAACLMVALGVVGLDRVTPRRTASPVTHFEGERRESAGSATNRGDVALIGLREALGAEICEAYQFDVRRWRVIRSGASNEQGL